MKGKEESVQYTCYTNKIQLLASKLLAINMFFVLSIPLDTREEGTNKGTATKVPEIKQQMQQGGHWPVVFYSSDRGLRTYENPRTTVSRAFMCLSRTISSQNDFLGGQVMV